MTQGCDRPQARMLPRAFFVLLPMFVVGCGVFDKGVSKTKDTSSPKLRLPAPNNVDKSAAIPPPSDLIPKPSAFGASTGRPDHGNASPIGSPPRGTNPAVLIPTPGPASPSVYAPSAISPVVVQPTMPTPPPAPPVQGTGASYQPTNPSPPTAPTTIAVPAVGPMPPTVSVGAPPVLPNP